MRRALPLIALTALAFAYAPQGASAQAAACAPGGEAQSFDPSFALSMAALDTGLSAKVDAKAPVLPAPSADWCVSPDDPRCSPVAPAPVLPELGAALTLLALPPSAPSLTRGSEAALAPPEAAPSLGPSQGAYARVERPPLSR